MEITFHLRHPFTHSPSLEAYLSKEQQVACQALLLVGGAFALYLGSRAGVGSGVGATALSVATFYTATAACKRSLSVQSQNGSNPPEDDYSPLALSMPEGDRRAPSLDLGPPAAQSPQPPQQPAEPLREPTPEEQERAWMRQVFTALSEGEWGEVEAAHGQAPQRGAALKALAHINEEQRPRVTAALLKAVLGSANPERTLTRWSVVLNHGTPPVQYLPPKPKA